MGASTLPPVGADRDLFSLSGGAMFTRRGSYIGISADDKSAMIYGRKMCIVSRRGGTSERSDNIFMYLYPTCRGEKIDYGIRTGAAELIFRTAYGEIRMCFASENMLYIRGNGGLGLRLERDMQTHEMMKKRGNAGAWEQVSHAMGTLLYVPHRGTLSVRADWDYDTLSTPVVRADVLPDADGEFLLSVEESLYGAVLHGGYPGYDEALADVTRDWNDFKATFPPLKDERAGLREQALWTEWSFLVSPSFRLKYPSIFMTGTAMASAWQMIQNAVAMQDNIPIRNGLLMNMLDDIGELGQLPDSLDDFRGQEQGIKPPIQGWGLKWIMKRHDLKAEIPEADLIKIYRGYGAWADWFMKYRDDDGDGIPEHGHGDDTGFDDSSAFADYAEIEAPDLPAYLAVLYDALGDLAGMLGRPGEAEEWYRRAKDTVAHLIRELWNGEMFICREARSHAPILSGSLIHYIPLVLGDRLPQDIIDKMTADLMREGEFLTPYGLASERLDSQQFRVAGMARGFGLPPYHLFILTGMYDAGKIAEAKEIARRYCAAQKYGFNMLVHPIREGYGGFSCSWPVCAFLTLADMIDNM